MPREREKANDTPAIENDGTRFYDRVSFERAIAREISTLVLENEEKLNLFSGRVARLLLLAILALVTFRFIRNECIKKKNSWNNIREDFP